MGDAKAGPVRLSFNPQLRVEFHGATVTSDAGLLLPRELDERLGLSTLIERHLADPRTGHNSQFPLPDLFRQSIYSRLAGYEDTNDAERLAEDPTFRMLASRERREISVALTSTLHWFETEVLAEARNYQGLVRLNTALVQHEGVRSSTQRVTLDVDSSESPVHGTQEQSAYNGHFECVCYHPLFVFNQHGDCLAATLRPGNVHSADGWEDVLLPVIDRYQARKQTVVVRADAAFALPALYEALERRGRGLCHPAPGQSGAGAENRGPAHPAPRPTKLRAAGPVSELPLSGGLLGPPATGDRQGRASPRGTLPPRGLHRHHLDRDEPGRRAFLQPAWHGGAVDQGGQRSHPLDPALLPPVPGQRGAVTPRGHRLQPRQPPAPTGPAPGHPELVPDESPTAALQDRWPPHSARPILCPAAGREPLDREPLSADSRPHRTTRVAPDLSWAIAPGRRARAARSAVAAVSLEAVIAAIKLGGNGSHRPYGSLK
jgi:hypothetical protein